MFRTYSDLFIVAATALALLVLCMVFPTTIMPGWAADNVLVLDQNEEITVSGIVESIDYKRFTLKTGDKMIIVDTDDLELDGNLDDLLSPGASVLVEGRYDENKIEAKKIVRLDAAKERKARESGGVDVLIDSN